MPIINCNLIKERLFEVRDKIARHYIIDRTPNTPNDFANAVIDALNQRPHPAPLERADLTNADVFEAAVTAIGSNMRPWATFVQNEPQLRDLLTNYDPVLVDQHLRNGQPTVADVRALLPGPTSGRDTEAIEKWSARLAEIENYYAFICAVGREMLQRAFGHIDPCTDAHLMLLIVGRLAAPGRDKLFGMGYTLASEFLRNLGWNGFKPDRHVRRLFRLWMRNNGLELAPEIENQHPVFLEILGRNTTELRDYLKFSLIGMSWTPLGMPYSEVDNLVWLLGAYVEKKGRESNEDYLIFDDE